MLLVMKIPSISKIPLETGDWHVSIQSFLDEALASNSYEETCLLDFIEILKRMPPKL